jgi:succinoglycan biosynthesis protein ExoA
MYDTGRWRREVVRRHPETASLRYLAAPVAVTGIVLGTTAGLLGLGRGPRLLRAGLAAPLGYLAIVVGGAATAGPLPVRARAWLPVVLTATHLSWGTGFLLGRPPTRS